MSLLKRLEHGATVAPTHPAPAPNDAIKSSPVAPTESAFRPVPIQSQATEAQRSLKERVKRKLISELDPSTDTNDSVEVRHVRAKGQVDVDVDSLFRKAG